MLLSTPCTSKPRRSKNSTASDPMSPALPVTRTFTSPGRLPGLPCQTPRAMRVAVTLEQCWHRVPGGTARATLDTVDAIAARGDVEQVGVSARHRSPAPAAWRAVHRRAAPARCRGSRCTTSWQRLRRPRVERATGPVDVVHSTAHVAAASTAPMVATVHDLHFLHEPSHFTRRGHRRVHPVPRPRPRRGGRGRVPVGGHPHATARRPGIDRARLRVTPWATHAVPVPPSEAARVRDGVRAATGPSCSSPAPSSRGRTSAGCVEAFARAGRDRRRAGDRRARGVEHRPGAVAAGPRVRRLGFVPGGRPRRALRRRRPSSPTRACGRASACRCSRRWCRAPRS